MPETKAATFRHVGTIRNPAWQNLWVNDQYVFHSSILCPQSLTAHGALDWFPLRHFLFSDARARLRFSTRTWGAVSGKNEDWQNP